MVSGIDLNSVVKDLNDELKAPVASVGVKGSLSDGVAFISTGILPLDMAISSMTDRGSGLPCGRLVEFYGQESSGKSTLLDMCMIECQKIGGVSVLLDTEVTRQYPRLITFGWNDDAHIQMVPETTEEAFNSIRKVVSRLREVPKRKTDVKIKKGSSISLFTEEPFFKRYDVSSNIELTRKGKKSIEIYKVSSVSKDLKSVDLLDAKFSGKDEADIEIENNFPVIVGYDTLSMSPTERELSNQASIADKPKIVRSELRKLSMEIAKKRVVLVIVGQTIDSIGGYARFKDTNYGSGAKFFASVRIKMHAGTKIKGSDGKTVIGFNSEFLIKKNKLRSPMATVTLPFIFDTGFDELGALIPDFVRLGVIKRSGGWYYIGDEKINGISNVVAYFKENDKVLDDCKNKYLEFYR